MFNKRHSKPNNGAFKGTLTEIKRAFKRSSLQAPDRLPIRPLTSRLFMVTSVQLSPIEIIIELTIARRPRRHTELDAAFGLVDCHSLSAATECLFYLRPARDRDATRYSRRAPLSANNFPVFCPIWSLMDVDYRFSIRRGNMQIRFHFHAYFIG